MGAGVPALAELRAVVERVVVGEGSITPGRLRDELVTSRHPGLAVLRQLDDRHVTRRPGMIVGFGVPGNGRFPGRARGCANV